jgi:hypothetical protein
MPELETGGTLKVTLPPEQPTEEEAEAVSTGGVPEQGGGGDQI